MLEIACFDLTSAETAMQSVADRIEFCSGIKFGGLTPDFEEFSYLKRKYRKPIFAMIRPVGGEFIYSEPEFLEMKRSILQFKNAGAAGFVFGILDKNHKIDEDKNRELVEVAGEIPCTFHRAFDRTKNLGEASETLIDIGFKTILTSGGRPSAMEGRENLKFLIENFSDKIEILIGGGVRSGNIRELKDFTKGRSFHSSAIPIYEQFANAEEIRKMKLAL